jgi:hypothetical protein
MSRGPGKRFTPERAREISLARHARRREARRLAAERGEQTESAGEVRDIVTGSGAPRMSDPKVLDLGDLVEVDGVLVPAAEAGGDETGHADPRSEAIVAPRPRQSPSHGDSIVAQELSPLASVAEVDLQTAAVTQPNLRPAPPVPKASGYEVCAGCGAKWPASQRVERRAQHAVMRQRYPGVSEAEQKSRDRCVAWCEGRA